MRTTIRLDDDLLREAKAYAAATDRTLTRLIEDALREALARRKHRARRPRVELPTSGGGGLQPESIWTTVLRSGTWWMG